jgi:hypothetical protein
VDLLAVAQDVADQERALLHGAFHGTSMTSLVGTCLVEARVSGGGLGRALRTLLAAMGDLALEHAQSTLRVLARGDQSWAAATLWPRPLKRHVRRRAGMTAGGQGVHRRSKGTCLHGNKHDGDFGRPGRVAGQ